MIYQACFASALSRKKPPPRAGSILSLALATVFLGPAAVRAATLAERAAAIDAPAPGKELKLSGPLQVGRAEIVPEVGTRVRVLTAGGVSCGLVVDGPARLRYRVEEFYTAPVERRTRVFSQGLNLRYLHEVATAGGGMWPR
ncbi:MAG TPA: hypothetical protein VJ725_09645 [Thermoanaerobaculia bacterium]|nr:hypothetical protein [Thermoanaerobaculia bacterium]